MGQPKKNLERHVKKHSAAIQIEGKLTLLQRKTWNALLWNAYNDLPIKDIYDIPIQKIMTVVGYDSKDEEYLKEATIAMMRCIVQWNVLSKDGSQSWGASVLLASVYIENGMCSYGFAPHLRQKLYNPDMFARLDLDLQKRFSSKYGLALWELCTDYLGGKRDCGETPWIEVDAFRKLMGVEGGIYDSFKRVTERVISPALAEVNRVSDFHVTVEHQRRGRKIMALKFKMRRVVMLMEPANTQAPLFPELDDMPALVRELTNAGLSTQDAFEIWQKGFAFVEDAVRPKDIGEDTEEAFAAYVQEKIHLLKRRQSSGKVENVTGFLREAIRKNYANPEYAEELGKEQAKRQRTAAAIAQHKATTIQERQAHLQRQHDAEIQALCNGIVEDFPVFLEQAVALASDDENGFNFAYTPWKTPAENYRDSIAVRAILNRYLERQHPKGFEEIRNRYNRDIEALKG